jgi:hypothetical protein
MQQLRHKLMAGAILLSISTAWAATPITLPTESPLRGQQPAPETMPIPIPEPPRAAPPPPPTYAPEPMPRPQKMPDRRPEPPKATPITLP